MLLVDDDRLVLSTLASGLEQAGYAVQACASVEEAQRVLALERPDIAILDVRLPGQSGLDMAKHLLAYPGLPFIFLTAFADDDVVQQAIGHGALGYLVKPVDISQLVPAIEAAVARSAELGNLRKTEQQLQTALNENREVSMAVGLLMERSRVSRQQAFESLRATARTQRRKIGDVAQEILSAAELLNLSKNP